MHALPSTPIASPNFVSKGAASSFSLQESIVDGSWLTSESFAHLQSLTQGPGRRPLKLLGISLFDGLGSFWLLVEPFVGKLVEWVGQYSCELDETCLAVLQHRHPKLTQLGPVECLNEERLRSILKDSGADIAILAGGSPCQQLSKAGCSKAGLSGKDSAFFWSLCVSPSCVLVLPTN